MAAKLLMNVQEAAEYIENLDVSSEDDLSDDEDFISRGRLVILPSNDENDRDVNKGSGELLPDIWNSSQLLAGATVDLSKSSGNILLGAEGEEEVVGLWVAYLQKGIINQR